MLLILGLCAAQWLPAQSSLEYKPLPKGVKVSINGGVADSMNAAIEQLDANFWLAGRMAAEADNPSLAIQTVRKAAADGGRANGVSYFDDWFDDEIAVSLYTEYDIHSLACIRWASVDIINGVSFSTGGKTVSTETVSKGPGMYQYNANIKITYKVTVDGETKTGIYIQRSEITSPVKLD